MGFKDQLAADLKEFMAADEFAETHNIDGQAITCIIDKDSLRQKAQDGVYGSVAVLFVETSALPDRPVPGQHMRIDGDLRLVQDCIENAGMFEITLEANEA